MYAIKEMSTNKTVFKSKSIGRAWDYINQLKGKHNYYMRANTPHVVCRIQYDRYYNGWRQSAVIFKNIKDEVYNV